MTLRDLAFFASVLLPSLALILSAFGFWRWYQGGTR